MASEAKTTARCIAFVFARAGSKGIISKNRQLVGEYSLLERAVLCGSACPSISEIFVSTDDPLLASQAEALGAKVPELRPDSLAQDDSPEIEAWRHAIKWVSDSEGKPDFDVFVSLPPTSPFRTPGDVERCIAALESHIDIVVSGYRSTRSPWFNMVTVDELGLAHILLRSEQDIYRRQKAPESFDLATVAYVSRPDYLLSTPSLLSGKVRLVEVDRATAIDIDDEYDLKVARALYQGWE